jgi:anti-sigma factor RsiW
MSPAEQNDVSDAQLVAYIDGELSATENEGVTQALSENAEARQRLEEMKSGARPFGEAFDLLLDAAPDGALQAMFADLVAKQPGTAAAAGGGETVVPFRKPKRPGGAPFWQAAMAAAILALVFTGGLYAGGFFNTPQQQKPSWREEAAGYVALFSRETLAGMPADREAQELNLRRVAAGLGLDLSSEKIANPALSFQGTQLLQFEGRPLAQISYLYGDSAPVALCIIKTANPAQPPAEEKRHGLNIVHWVAGGYGYMVLGKVPEPELRQISDTFRARFS